MATLSDRFRSQPLMLGNPLSIQHVHQNILDTDRRTNLEATRDQLGRHMAVLGVSGSGKSKFLELFCRRLIESGSGFTFIDPHGDTAEAILAYVAKSHSTDPYFHHRFHYIQPSVANCFAFEPLDIPLDDVPRDKWNAEFSTRRQTFVDRLVRVLMREYTEADQELMKLRRKWLRHVLTAVATPVDDAGNRMALSDAWLLLHPEENEFKELYPKLRPRLPRQTQIAFDNLQRTKRQGERDAQTSSTENLFTDILTDLTQAVYGRQTESINLRRIISNHEMLVVNLKETDNLSRDASKPIAALLIQQIGNVCKTFEQKGQRTPHYLILDEAARYVAEDLGDFLDEARKWRLSVCLGAQTLSSFRKGKVDLSEQIRSHCKTFVSFQQRNNRDVEELGKYFALPNYVLYERLQEVDRPGKDEIITLKDKSRSHNQSQGKTTSEGTGETLFLSNVNSQTNALSLGRSVGKTRGRNWMSGHSENTGIVDSSFQTQGLSGTLMNVDGQLIPMETPITSAGMGNALQRGSGSHDASGGSEAESEAQIETRLRAETIGTSEGSARSTTSSTAATTTEGTGESITEKQQLVQRTRVDYQATGDARYAIPFQNARYEYLLSILPDQYAFVRSKVNNVEQTILFRVADVCDPFDNLAEERSAVSEFLARINPLKPYLFVMQDPEKSRRERLNRLLGVQAVVEYSDSVAAVTTVDRQQGSYIPEGCPYNF